MEVFHWDRETFFLYREHNHEDPRINLKAEDYLISGSRSATSLGILIHV